MVNSFSTKQERISSGKKTVSSTNGAGKIGQPQAEDGIRDLVRSRGLGDVYKRQQYGTGTKTDT